MNRLWRRGPEAFGVTVHLGSREETEEGMPQP
jgi:hypothetical protein